MNTTAADLKAFLRRLRLQPNTPVPTNARVQHPQVPLETFLGQCVRQGYLDLQRLGDAKGAQKKRGRALAATQAGNGEEAVILEWRWGPRARAEVGEQDVARFVADFMVERARREATADDDDDDDIEETPEVKKLRERTFGGIEKAAGGQLAALV